LGFKSKPDTSMIEEFLFCLCTILLYFYS